VILPEIRQISILNEMWNKHRKYGLVTFKIMKCEVYYNCDSRIQCKFYKKAFPHAHSIIIGYHVDLENKKRKNFIGYNFLNAKQRMNHVQSFL
jgi:hypothetical protein